MASDPPQRPHGGRSTDSHRQGPRGSSTDAQRGGSAPQRRGGRETSRTRASLSLDQIIEAAVTTLDAVGAEKMTLRGLAAQLDSGVASLYWYASGKDQLMAIVADELLGRALDEAEELERAGLPQPKPFAKYPLPAPDERTSAATAEALVRIRRLVLCLFVQMLDHPWLAFQLIKTGPDEQNSLSYWELVGQALQTMELDPTDQFHASLAVVNYASGMGAEVSQGAIYRDAVDDPEAEFADQISHWASLDEAKFPFVHSVLDEFRKFDDRSEFVKGLDLILSGLERLTWN